ncbi:MAG: glycosyltransferase family 2 protein [Deltaproteobacteria bacterium]|nr:glycosyltransferase family 2 protein [Deltaproteobacteria bacterium]
MSVHCQTVSLIKSEEAGSQQLEQQVAILIPAYNEAQHLEALIERTMEIEPAFVVIIDDASTDRSAEVLQKLQARYGEAGNARLHVLNNEQNLGKQGSIRCGLRYLRDHDVCVDVVALIDGDGQHDPAELPALCGLLRYYDVVLGARCQQEMPLHRRFSNGLVNVGYALIGGVDFVDVQSGLRIYSWAHAMLLAEELPEEGGYSIEHESLAILARHAQAQREELRIAAATISCAYGPASSMTPRDLWELAVQTVRQAFRVRRYQRPLPAAWEVSS